MTSLINARKAGSVGRITLNRPEALNALNQEMVDGLIKALLDWREDDAVKAIVVDGAGGKGFCAGGDIRMLAESGKKGGAEAWKFWRDEYQLNTLIFEYPKPYVALIDGITMGGGVGISVHGSHRVAGDRTMFAMPETGIGFHPDVGGAYFLPRLKGETGMWMGLTGARLKAADSLAAGVATHYVPSDRQEALIAALESADLDNDGETLEDILETHAGDPGDSELAHLGGLIDAAFSGDELAVIKERLQSAGDAWSARQLSILNSKSPSSCAITLAALRKGAELDFREVMAQDLRVSMRLLVEGSDFYEGVRAVIIDKDNAPHWGPQMQSEAVEAMFAPLESDREQSFLG
ncbi:enoyl-CoA hydratase/isomerase family protein [Synechococcus moorigangaii CMS01]|nr:enoyl-CoA hydratase/isomerase family protein [Synechococcus moorigangaii CMS01]